MFDCPEHFGHDGVPFHWRRVAWNLNTEHQMDAAPQVETELEPFFDQPGGACDSQTRRDDRKDTES